MGCAGSAQKEHGEADAGAGGYDDQGGEEYQPLTQDEVNARIQCCDKTQHFTLAETGITLRYAYLSQRGYYPEDLYKANQDAFKIIEKFNGNPNCIFLGVFCDKRSIPPAAENYSFSCTAKTPSRHHVYRAGPSEYQDDSSEKVVH